MTIGFSGLVPIDQPPQSTPRPPFCKPSAARAESIFVNVHGSLTTQLQASCLPKAA
jgi:hypothetical protein